MKRTLALLLFFSAPLFAQTPITNITVQPAEWQAMKAYPSGTRTNAPVTFGLGLADSLGISCPGTQDLPQNEGSPAQLVLEYNGTQVSSQFRCMEFWPDTGNAKWVQVDAQIASFAESAGFDGKLTVSQVASGGGNVTCNPTCGAATNMAGTCTGAGAPDSDCPGTGYLYVNTTAAHFIIKEAHYNLFDDVQVGSTHLVAHGNHGVNDGLYLQGPLSTLSGLVNQVSCAPTANGSTVLSGASGPLPVPVYTANACTDVYLSSNDSASTCVIEENGSLRSVLMCQGNLIDASSNTYMQFRTRMHFWANHSDTKVEVALRNAQVSNMNVQSFANSYKHYQEWNAIVTDNLGSTRSYGIAKNTGVVSSSGFLTSQYAYLFTGQQNEGIWTDFLADPNCTIEADNCVVWPIARSGAGASTREAGIQGAAIYENSATPSTVLANNSVACSGDPNPCGPIGWSDIDDGTNGIETGIYQLSMYWPGSLEYQVEPSGASSGNEIRIGMRPNQVLANTSGTFGTNTILNTVANGGTYSTTSNSQAITPYVIGAAQYKMSTIYFNFHLGLLGGSGYAAAQNDFLYFQHYMLARPSSPTYYNGVIDSTNNLPALFYNIPDPVTEDTLYINRGLCSGTTAGACVGDVGSANFAFTGQSNQMMGFPYFDTVTGGPQTGSQFEMRESFIRNWEQRGCTPSGTVCGATATTGSTPGRFIWALHWYQMMVEHFVPRSDTASTSGTSAGWRSLMYGLSPACTSNITTCDALNWGPEGFPHTINTGPATTLLNGGMRNWLDGPNIMEHSVDWGIYDAYHFTGNEWYKEVIMQGEKDMYLNPFVPFYNISAQASANGASGHGHINGTRAVGHTLSHIARLASFLCGIGDADCDTLAHDMTVPGANIGSVSPLQSGLSILASEVVIPFINGGYPVGMSETTGTNVYNFGTTAQNLASQGTSPIRGYVRSAGAAESCSIQPAFAVNHTYTLGTQVPDNLTPQHVQQVTTAGTSQTSGVPSWNATTGGTTTSGTVVFTNEGPAQRPCNGSNFRSADTFQVGSWNEGILDFWMVSRQIFGPNWHILVGAASSGPSVINGATTMLDYNGNQNVLVSEKGLLDALYGAGLKVNAENCIYTSGNYNASGCIYTTDADDLNIALSSPGPGCISAANCLLSTSPPGHTLTNWHAIGGQAATTNSIADLTGTYFWQWPFNAVLTPNDASIKIELGSHMLQNFIASYVIPNGSISGSTTLAVSPSIVSLQPVSVAVTACTGTGCAHSSTGCVAGSAAGTCTITWSAPAGLCSIGSPTNGCPPNGASNGTQYRLKYYYCTGSLTPLGNDCPSGGKAIVPTLGFDITGANGGTVLSQNVNGSPGMIEVGTVTKNPANFVNFFAVPDVPNCGNGTTCGGAANNSTVPSGTSYTFNTAANTTYNFALYAYQSSSVGLAPSSCAFRSAAIGTSTTDSLTLPDVVATCVETLTNNTGSTITISSTTYTGDFGVSGAPCTGTIVSSGTCSFTVAFTPTSTGLRSGGVTIVTSAATVTASYTGTGLASGQVCLIPPVFGAGCNALYTFVPSVVGTPSSDSPENTVLSNTSGATISTLSFGFSGTNPGDFSFPSGNTCGSSVANNTTCSTGVTFTPAAASPPTRMGNLSVSYGGGGGGTTHTAASCSAVDVSAVINGPTYTAVDGDTILVPGSMCGSGSPVTWAASGSTPAINITKNITLNLQGAFVNLAGTSSSQAIVVHTTSTASTNFVLENFNFNNTTSAGVGGGQMVVYTGNPGSSSTQTYRITAGTWTDAGASSSGIFFNHGGVGPGLIDHVTFNAAHGSDEVLHNTGCGNGVFTCWQDDLTPGGPNFFFVETNIFNNTSGSAFIVSAMENFTGARTVFRYNTLNGGSVGIQYDAHGAGGPASCTGHGVENNTRWWEAYNNTWTSPQVFALRGGSGVIFNNTDSVSGNIGFTEDCTSGTYPINGQIGRGIATTSGQGGDTRSPAYSWANTNMTNTSGNTTFVQVGTAVADATNCSANPSNFCDAIHTSTQPSTLLKCETAADITAGCPVSYTYTPYTYPHPLTAGTTITVSAPLAGTGIGTSVTISPTSYGFQTTVAGSGPSADSPFGFTITNNTASPISGITATISGGANPADFAAANVTCTGTLGVGNTCTVSGAFVPLLTDCPTGSCPLSATLSVSWSGGGPITAALSGTATAPVVSTTTAPCAACFVGNMKASGDGRFSGESIAASKTFTLNGVVYTRGGK